MFLEHLKTLYDAANRNDKNSVEDIIAEIVPTYHHEAIGVESLPEDIEEENEE